MLPWAIKPVPWRLSCSTLFLSGIPEACGAGTEDALIAGKIQMYGS
jgi:hypothetical protein